MNELRMLIVDLLINLQVRIVPKDHEDGALFLSYVQAYLKETSSNYEKSKNISPEDPPLNDKSD